MKITTTIQAIQLSGRYEAREFFIVNLITNAMFGLG